MDHSNISYYIDYEFDFNLIYKFNGLVMISLFHRKSMIFPLFCNGFL